MIYDIHCPPLILAPLVNMSKGSCENKSVFFNNFYLSFTKLYPIIELLPSGRRYRTIKAKANRLKNSTYPRAVAIINEHSVMSLMGNIPSYIPSCFNLNSVTIHSGVFKKLLQL